MYDEINLINFRYTSSIIRTFYLNNVQILGIDAYYRRMDLRFCVMCEDFLNDTPPPPPPVRWDFRGMTMITSIFTTFYLQNTMGMVYM